MKKQYNEPVSEITELGGREVSCAPSRWGETEEGSDIVIQPGGDGSELD